MTRDRRQYAREYARRRRAEQLAALNAGASTCQARLGMHGRCGGLLETITDGQGRTSLRCPLCERKRAGICRECGLPVAGQRGKALRCEHHMKVEHDRAWRRHRERDPEANRRASRRNYQRNAERRRQKNEYKRQWRLANREKVRAQKRRSALRNREHYLEYHRKRREREREQLAARERSRGRGITELRTCITPGCDVVVTHRKKKCSKCRERDRVQAVEALAQHTGRGRRTDLEHVA